MKREEQLRLLESREPAVLLWLTFTLQTPASKIWPLKESLINSLLLCSLESVINGFYRIIYAYILRGGVTHFLNLLAA